MVHVFITCGEYAFSDGGSYFSKIIQFLLLEGDKIYGWCLGVDRHWMEGDLFCLYKQSLKTGLNYAITLLSDNVSSNLLFAGCLCTKTAVDW